MICKSRLGGLSMKRATAAVVAQGVLAVCLTVSDAVAQDTRPRVRVSGISDGQLLTSGDKVFANVPADSVGVEFFFQPETSGDVVSPRIFLGRDDGHIERTFGPDCGGPCEKQVFSVPLDKQFSRLDEGWGQLTVHDIGTGQEASVRVYWDSTPPVSRFQSPRFNARPDSRNTFEIVAHSFDEDIVSINVHWILAVAGARDIPTFEQHFLGYDFAQHAACVPTSVSANLQWLQNTGQAQVVNPVFAGDPKKLVTAMGSAMQTDSSGTGGNDTVDGTAFFLFFTEGLLPDRDYTMEHVFPGPNSGKYGFTPQEMLEQFEAGGVVALGFHNLSGDLSFGHVMALSKVVLNDDGTAWIYAMDPNVEPNPNGQTVGQFRWFKLHANGKVDWTAANTGYYSPESGSVKLDELLTLRDFAPPAAFAAIAADSAITPDAVPTSGEVPGRLTGGGHTFVGKFTPPPGSPGPWLLISETTHRAGHTKRAYRYIGGKFGDVSPQ
jgi:hypothetical protein